jgi:gamma-glutamyltranspeptidase/glutathione hydrolase
VPFTSLRLAAAKTHQLVVRVADASPGESNTTNDEASMPLLVAMYDADGAVASENLLATKAGADILRAGGNAFDAAAAVLWALNVVEPENAGLGGGVNAVVHLANGEDYALDGRETAPAAVTPTYYNKGKGYARNGFSVGVPGALRTMEYMLEHWGTMTLAQTLQPAIALAENGIPVSKQLATSINNRGWMDPDAKEVFWPDGVQKREGDILVNADLAKAFRLIAEQGPSAFYEGPIAEAIVAAQRKSYDHDPLIDLGGVMTTEDLAAYEVVVTEPISIDYRGYDVLSAGPSTGGGVVVLQMLQMVEQFPLGSDPAWGFQSPNASQAMLEAMRLGFADQNFWLGDPAFYPEMPLEELLSDDYLAWRGSLIDPGKRMPNPLPGYAPGFAAPAPQGAAEEPAALAVEEGGHTSHFTIVDRWGNVVAATPTLGDGLGCTIMVPGYGFVLNDTAGRLLNATPVAGTPRQVLTPAGPIQVANPGASDAAGGKRGMGNVAPVIVELDGEPILATGGAGGAQIMPVVFQIVTNVLDHDLPLQAALSAPRLWGDNANVNYNGAEAPIPLFPTLVGTSPWSDVPQWFLGAPAFPADTLAALAALGDPVKAPSRYPQVGGAQSIAVDPDTYALTAASDPRGLWAVGYPIVLEP